MNRPSRSLAEQPPHSVDEAFSLLRHHAHSHNPRLSDLAMDVAQGSATATELVPGP